ncbi:RNA 2'-phosphotransferase [Rhodocytophaga rosea]|uniref:Probable RNA 2'-phosphotransferase n=1 Tax=Rhodocytophaga rosea TaxID=2704465 RepID=A0A6C0GUJ4_9BACT|nr:RNA 2'-phosphotransferase [Rhodocytophaga rosea]QHT71223.1 RNA 2'-phosphotransferase [Rhodocytophaga rosea]
MKDKDISKYLSLVLRHQPQVLGITLDESGWTEVNGLLEKMQQKGMNVDFEKLSQVVQNNDKQRFAFNADQSKIRASQGHSVSIELGLTPVQPPEVLYHGTAQANMESILKDGIQKRSRQHVHLSADEQTAIKVGQRHGKPVVLQVNSGDMNRDGHLFYLSENKVWLTDFVEAKYIQNK